MEIRFDRLKKLAKHLKTGKLAHVKFDFSLVHRNGDKLTPKQKKLGFCGTAGCAVGELPAVFPRTWSYKKASEDVDFKQEPVVSYKGDVKSCFINGGTEESRIDWNAVQTFFGINENEKDHLFIPGGQEDCWMSPEASHSILHSNASRKEVAENIEWFIKNNGFRS